MNDEPQFAPISKEVKDALEIERLLNINYIRKSQIDLLRNELRKLNDDYLANMQAVQVGVSKLNNKMEIAMEALKAIANQDYRGNRSQESSIAFEALSKINKKEE